MRQAPAQHRAYTYKVTAAPAGLAVECDAAKTYLRVRSSKEDDLITALIGTATQFAEQFTRRDFITRTYTTFRDFFPSCGGEGYYYGNVSGGNDGFELRRSPLQTVEEISYLVSASPVIVDPTIYYNTVEEDYSEVLTLDGSTWPTDADKRLQAITIVFKAGLGDTAADMPAWVAEGILQHVAAMYENRGDCLEAGTCGKLLPPTAKMLYLQNRIENL